MKTGKSYLKLLGALVLGGIIGGALSMMVLLQYDQIIHVAKGAERILDHIGIVIEGIFVLGFVTVVTILYFYSRSLWKKEEAATDEEADLYGEKFEKWSQIGVTVSEIAAGIIIITGFLTIPPNFPNGNVALAGTFLTNTSIMLLGAIYMAILEIMYYHLIQKRDPQKKGDPSSFSFNKKWLASCDETEKMVIYQAGYKGFSVMQILVLVGIIIAGIGKFDFDTGNFPIVLLGIVWIGGNLTFGRKKMRGLRK